MERIALNRRTTLLSIPFGQPIGVPYATPLGRPYEGAFGSHVLYVSIWGAIWGTEGSTGQLSATRRNLTIRYAL